MKRKVLSMLMMMLALAPAAIAQQLTPLPLNPQVKSGVLPNGLSYYVLHNEEPKGRANFYIAQKVGSTLETPDQLGLAHFLEHMAFNGTKNYPGRNMLNYLETKGIRFGADINAYTSFDETVYNLNNIPTADKALMDSVLLVLRDWSGDILLEEDEINAERGVIQEEWRQRNNAQTRMFTQMLPQIYEEYQYEQMPIGKMEVVMNFKPETLRAYYKKWYRPDQQGIVVVGDFDAAEMEAKIKEMFSSIPMPADAAERTYPKVSDNEKPIFASFEDPELQQDMVMLSFKYDKTPFEMRNTQEAYVQDVLLRNVMARLINNRLDEYKQNPDCKYAYAGVNFGDFYVSKTKGAFDVITIPVSDPKAAFADAMAIVARACQQGFTDSELERVNSQMIANYEKMYNERNKTDNDARAQELIRHFIDNEPAPGIETEFEMVKQILPMLPVQAYNEIAKQLLTPTNQVVVVSQHKAEGRALPSQEEMLAVVNNAMNTTYEAYVDEVVTEPLIAKLPAPGKIKEMKKGEKFDTYEYRLSNGVKVIVKPTDFADDRIVLNAFRMGGKNSYEKSQAARLAVLEDVYETAKMGPFNATMLKKYMAGKKASLGYGLGLLTSNLEGSTTVKDLPTLMELIYASFTALTPDKDFFTQSLDRIRPQLANMEKNPMYVFQCNLSKSMWANPMMDQVTSATLDAVDYDQAFALLSKSLSNATDYTFILTGNVDPEGIKPYLEQYIATLPSTGKCEQAPVVNPIALVSGKVSDDAQMPMQTPMVATSTIISGDNMDFNAYNNIRIDLMSEVLQIIYTATLREQEGGTYGAQTGSQILPASRQWMLQYVYQTGPESREKLAARAQKELANMLANGTDAETFGKVKEQAITQFDLNMRDNDWWSQRLGLAERGYDLISGYREALQAVTLEDFNAFMAKLYNGQNEINVTISPEDAK